MWASAYTAPNNTIIANWDAKEKSKMQRKHSEYLVHYAKKNCVKNAWCCAELMILLGHRKGKGKHPKPKVLSHRPGRNPSETFLNRWRKAKSFERGESNGNRRNILQAYEARHDAVTETIKVIAIKKEHGFQTTRTNRLKSAIGFWPKFARQLWGSDPLYEISGMTTDDEHGSRQRESKVRKQEQRP
jgi:hypothetical protein